MRRAWVWLKRLLVGLVVLALVLAVGGIVTVRRSFPQVDGTAQLSGLSADVSVVRDASGVPHIYATSSGDLYMAQGYVHAQERFFQMDFWRHIGSARLSEMFGDSTLETDQFLRTLRLVPIAEQELAALPAEDVAILEAYSAGINGYLAERTGSALSLEYAIIGLTNRGYEPHPWTPTDTLTWAKMMSWDLGSNMDRELSRALTAGVVGVERTEQLWPAYPEDQPVIVPTGTGSTALEAPSLVLDDVTELADLAELVAAVRNLTGESGADIGSNNWVVDGSKTTTGMPILANDPHLTTQMPSIWFQVGLHCVGDSDGCPFNVAGFSFAGTPGVVIGHNDRIAWGVTNLAPDTQDLVIERINPDNPNQYEVNGEWVDMEVFTESIEVAGSGVQELEIRWTRNGPLITETFGGLDDLDATAGGVEVPDSYAVSLRWTSLQPTRLVESIIDVNQAQNWEQFRSALSNWDIAAQNVVYADVEGNIGYQSTGLIPLRAGGDGRWPVPGWTDEHNWTGTIPFDDMPFLLNPDDGFIVTANNAVVDNGYPHLITADWAYGYRADRIAEVLQSSSSIDVPFMNDLQNDGRNDHAGELIPHLLAVDSDDEAVNAVQESMETWAGAGSEALQNSADSGGAAAYNATWRHLLINLLDELDPEEIDLSGRDRMFVVSNQLANVSSDPWWDLTATEPLENRDEILELAMRAASDELVDRFGSDTDDWRWGALHTVEFRNGTLGESGIAPIEALFNRGPFEVGGGTSLVNAMSWSPVDGYEVIAIPSMRMVVDLSNFDSSTTIHSTGQSGHAYHPHYIDMAQSWADGLTLPMRWSEGTVRENPDGVLVLTP